ncbi:MAG TPA: hypothetical protein VFU94_11205, partial [Conexibacter sp.]|nr:hypothetical protein [Conexibacter sp.]
AVVVLLGPPLSHVLFRPPSSFHFLAHERLPVHPEPLKDTRYLLLLLGPLLLALATVGVARRRRATPTRARALAVAAAQAAGAAFVAVCFLAQRDPRWGTSFFDDRALAVAALMAVAVVAAARARPARELAARVLRETTARRVAATALAVLAAAIWVLPAVNSEHSTAWALLSHDAAFHLDETFAVLDGLTPLTDFHAQYASLLPYPIALTLLAFGKTLLVFTIAMCALEVISFAALFGVLRRAAGSALAALLLFVPVLATALFSLGGTDEIRFTFGTYFPMFPLRYGGPCVLAWLLARHLDRGDRGERAWPLFAAAGLVLLNNLEFGAVAFAATVAALVTAGEDRSRRALARLGGEIVLGTGGAIAAYALVSLVRAGALPRFGGQLEYARLYGAAGFSNYPLPTVLGLQLVIYATYVAAIAAGVVRALARERNRALTGALVWTGVFGLGSATYYVARAGAVFLPSTFAAWALALALLSIVAVRAMAERPRLLPGVATLATLFGFGLCVTPIAMMPLPEQQIQRVHAPPPGIAFRVDPSPLTAAIQPSASPAVRAFVISLADGPHRFVARHGAPVALFATQGHRIAYAYGVRDVVPYTGPESIHTVGQLDESLDALRDAGGNTALVSRADTLRLSAELLHRGFAVLTRAGLRAGAPFRWDGVVVVGGLTKWVDARRLHPAALG